MLADTVKICLISGCLVAVSSLFSVLSVNGYERSETEVVSSKVRKHYKYLKVSSKPLSI